MRWLKKIKQRGLNPNVIKSLVASTSGVTWMDKAGTLVSVDGVRFGMKSLILSASLEEWFENAFLVMEVIVNNVDQEASFHKLINQLLRRGILFVQFGPLCA
jgi:hypothetical protein